MSIRPIDATPASTRVRKPLHAPSTSSQAKRKSRPRIDVEDDDWVPLSATMTPTRVIRELIENDYDMM